MTLLLLIPAVIAVVFVSRAYRQVDDAYVAEWAAAHALDLTPVNRPMVAWYLLNARVLRTLGVLAGLFLPTLVANALGFHDAFGPLWMFVGYLVGALYAEVALTRPAGAARAASLQTRRLADYLPARLLRTQRVVALTALVASGIAVVFPYPTDLSGRPSRVGLLAIGAFVVVWAFALERLQQWVVQRPQPVSHPDLLAADDAIRAQSVHSLSGSGLAVELTALSSLWFVMAISDVQVLRWVMSLGGRHGDQRNFRLPLLRTSGVASAAHHAGRRHADMILEIDGRSAVPPYEQIRDQIITLVHGGVLASGTRLPPIRQLANDLGLAGGTVARAYRELEADGVVATRGRHGTVVAGLPRNAREPGPELKQAAAAFAREIRRLGARDDDAMTAVRAALAAGRSA